MEGAVRGCLAFHPGHRPNPHCVWSPFTSSPPVHPVLRREFPRFSRSKSSQSNPACFARRPYKNMAALRAPPCSRHAPGNRSGFSAGLEDGGIWRRAADLGTVFGVTKGPIAGSLLLACGRTGSAGLSRSHCGLAHSPGPPSHYCLSPGAGAHAQGGPRGEAPNRGVGRSVRRERKWVWS